MPFDTIWTNARLATMAPGQPGLGIIEHGCVASKDGRIVFAGTAADMPSGADAMERIDCDGRWITPGLVDCHTHLIFGGNRANEFAKRFPTPAAALPRACWRRAPRRKNNWLPAA
jgi:imidazolonepropionase